MPAISAEGNEPPHATNSQKPSEKCKSPVCFSSFCIDPAAWARAKGERPISQFIPLAGGKCRESGAVCGEREKTKKHQIREKMATGEMEREGDGEKIAASVLEKKGGGKEGPFQRETEKGRFHNLLGSVDQIYHGSKLRGKAHLFRYFFLDQLFC